jgi:hypothetical protein
MIKSYKKLTAKQRIDILSILYFSPIKGVKITVEDIIHFLDYSDNGLDKAYYTKYRTKEDKQTGKEVLLAGKKYRGVSMGMFEEGLLEGVTPYYTLLGGENGDQPLPYYVMEFMRKEMFKGIDSEHIKKIWDKISEEKLAQESFIKKFFKKLFPYYSLSDPEKILKKLNL